MLPLKNQEKSPLVAAAKPAPSSTVQHPAILAENAAMHVGSGI
jgi:hypothetical protein